MKQYYELFLIPFAIVVGILLYFLLISLGYEFFANLVILAVIILGSYQLVIDTYNSMIHGEFALDYIAILAISVGIISGQYIVSAFIVLMMAGGNTLEKYGMAKAKKALTGLVDRIPSDVMAIGDSGEINIIKIEDVKVNQKIKIRKGEVVPLDGILVIDDESENISDINKIAMIDESTLTGEPYPVNKTVGSNIYSGTVNVGEVIVICVTKTSDNSTYGKIVKMVQSAQENKSGFVRMADQYSVVFTIITLAIAGIAYRLHRDINAVLSVLVIATPCPLILAAPIALMGGINSAANKMIIIKNLGAIEKLSKVDSLILDKTGTITLGKPKVTEIELYDDTLGDDLYKNMILGVVLFIESNSLHPLAKAVVNYITEQNIKSLPVKDIKEVIGKGIQGNYEGHIYMIGKVNDMEGMNIGIYIDDKLSMRLKMEDEIKSDSIDSIRKLISDGFDISMYTGDHQSAARQVADQIDPNIKVVADCKPEDKQKGIMKLHNKNKVVAMVGDGINDAPALAMADVGMVFGNNEQTATTETADVVFLSPNFTNVYDSINISRGAVYIAKQSILFGIGLSTLGMILAALGYIPPLRGAASQELIDVLAILNALRASSLK